MKFPNLKIIAITIALGFLSACASTSNTSSSMTPNSRIGNLDVSEYTNANLIVYKSQSIAAPPEKIWKIVSNHSLLPKWLPMVNNVDVLNDKPGVGGERVCTLGKDTIREKVVHVEKNRVIAIHAADTPMFTHHLSVIEIIDQGTGVCRVNFSVFFDPHGLKGFLMKNMMLPMVTQKALKNLKAMAEASDS